MSNLIRFDWAIKRILRNKADYCIVEGLLTTILGKTIRIKSLLESEGNKDAEDDKFNRVDLLAEDEAGELMIFEIQNDRQLDYFHRMAYGTAKVLSEYMKEGEPYENIRKVYSINIVYFSLGQGKDYVYHGITEFRGIHGDKDILLLTAAQKKNFKCETPADIFPEYYILRVDKFDKIALKPLDEWISFLKDGEIPVTYNAPGLPEARERLRIDSLTEEEQKAYRRRMENLRYEASVIETGRIEGIEKGIEIGEARGEARGIEIGEARGIEIGEARGIEIGEARGIEIGEARERQKANEEKLATAKSLKALGKLSLAEISDATGLSEADIEAL